MNVKLVSFVVLVNRFTETLKVFLLIKFYLSLIAVTTARQKLLATGRAWRSGGVLFRPPRQTEAQFIN
jgi:hypothetical protein